MQEFKLISGYTKKVYGTNFAGVYNAKSKGSQLGANFRCGDFLGLGEVLNRDDF